MEVSDEYLQRLMKLWPPFSTRHHTGALLGFSSVEAKLGLVLPIAFKELTHAYAQGVWFDTIYILNPFVEWDGRNEPWYCSRLGLTGGPEWCDRMRKVRKKHPDWFSRYPIYPEPGGIFPWAFVYGGGVLYWLTQGPAERWATLEDPRANEDEWEQLDMSVTEILWKLAVADPGIEETVLDRAVRQFRDSGLVAYR